MLSNALHAHNCSYIYSPSTSNNHKNKLLLIFAGKEADRSCPDIITPTAIGWCSLLKRPLWNYYERTWDMVRHITSDSPKQGSAHLTAVSTEHAEMPRRKPYHYHIKTSPLLNSAPSIIVHLSLCLSLCWPGTGDGTSPCLSCSHLGGPCR